MRADGSEPYGRRMKRASVFVVVAILVAACDGSPSSQPDDQSQAPGQSQAQGGASQAPVAGGGGGDGAALADAANAVTDWCTLMPADLVAELVPGDAVLQAEEFPSRCTASNQVQALQVSYQGFSGAEPFSGAIMVPGLGETAWLEPDYPVDDAYLTVILYTDPNGNGASTLYVEIANRVGRVLSLPALNDALL
jgi:hypothetical protein